MTQDGNWPQGPKFTIKTGYNDIHEILIDSFTNEIKLEIYINLKLIHVFI